jgi:hypothetical protein
MTRSIETLFAMSEDTWARHANPWSVWTRFTVLPLVIAAVWSRVWIGAWAWIPVLLVSLWAWLNPRLFPKPRSTENWASRAVLGERLWLARRETPIPKHHRLMPHLLSSISALGLPFLVWGLWKLNPWPTAIGTLLVYAGKVWFLDRMVWLWMESRSS